MAMAMLEMMMLSLLTFQEKWWTADVLMNNEIDTIDLATASRFTCFA
jgi:hypothetical protein